jgi:Fur family peroxide stress response transcriptional regulator
MAVPSSEVVRRMAAFREALRREDLKSTPQRLEVFRELAASDKHPDAETVHGRVRRRLPAISLDTVYRTLAALEAAGVVRRTAVFGGPARFDANVGPHHHFVCTRCGRVQDFAGPALDDLPLPPGVKALGQVESAHVQVRGLCAACARRKRATRRPCRR